MTNKKLRFFNNLIFTVASLAMLMAFAPVKDPFTGAEQQSINVETPGLFEKSDAFSIDFTTIKEEDYSFPLPVGKAEAAQHSWLEIGTTTGDAVKAMFEGTVRLSKKMPDYGNVIVIRHTNGLETVYANNAQNLVKVGDEVKAGQTIAIVGTKDERTFCNFSIMVNGRRINPETIVDIRSHKLRKQTIVCKKNGERIQLSVVKAEKEAPAPIIESNPFEKKNSIQWDLTQMTKETWAYPLPGCKVISPYGNRRNKHIHSGVDLKTKANDNILAAFDGEVIESGYNGGYGNCIKIKHGNGLVTLYGHQSKNLVKVGQQVKAGQVIGLTGRTGHATTEHLHLEIFFQNRRYNPNILFNHERHQLQNAVLTINKNGSVTSKKK